MFFNFISKDYFRPNDSPMRSVLPASRMEIERFNEEDDIMIVEETSISAHNSCSKPSSSASSFKNKYASEFGNNDFNFDDCEIIVDTEKSQRFSIFLLFYLLISNLFSYFILYTYYFSKQDKNLLKNKTKAYFSPKSNLATLDTSTKIKKNIEVLTKQNKKSVVCICKNIYTYIHIYIFFLRACILIYTVFLGLCKLLYMYSLNLPI